MADLFFFPLVIFGSRFEILDVSGWLYLPNKIGTDWVLEPEGPEQIFWGPGSGPGPGPGRNDAKMRFVHDKCKIQGNFAAGGDTGLP